MKLRNFEDWFAIRSRHGDEDHWPGRLVFDLDKGISLATARFVDGPETRSDPTFRAATMTGWLGYERPATLIRPMIRTIGGLNFGVNTPALRASYDFVAEAVLRNIFLEDIDEPIFTGLAVDDPALHAWINPNLVSHEWDYQADLVSSRLSVAVAQPRQRRFTLSDGTEAVVTSAIRTPRDAGLILREYSALRLRLPRPVTYEAITRLTWRLSTLFSFLIGARVGAPVYELPTTRTRPWNGNDQEVVAEYWYRPARKGVEVAPDIHRRLLVEGASSLTLPQALELLVGGRDELLYLANMIQTVDDNAMSITQGFGELLGCLERFDEREFDNGADPNVSAGMTRLANLVREHGSEDDQAIFARLRQKAPNRYSLLDRLQRLHGFWQDDSFRTAPDLRRIVQLRNIIPHGRGLQVSGEIAQEMLDLTSYLVALARYHVLRALGCTGGEIAAAFRRQPFGYGLFVPRDARDESGTSPA